MAKKPTITTVSSGYNSATTLNNNLIALRDGFENTLSLDGSTPNAMQADLDLDGNDILNVGNITADDIIVDGSSVSASAAAAAASATEAAGYAASAAATYDGFDDRYLGPKASAPTTDNDGDALLEGALYFDTTLKLLYTWNGSSWQNAASGALLVANNLSDIGTASTARTNLGLAIGTDVQAFDAGLLSIAGLTTAANKLLYTTASDVYATADLTAAGRALLDDADASAQRTTLGLGTIATQAATSVNIDGGVIDGVTIGATSPAPLSGTDIEGDTLSDGVDTVDMAYPVNGAATVTLKWNQGTVTTYQSFNVSSLTDTSTGVTDVGLTNYFAAADTQFGHGSSSDADHIVSARGFAFGTWTTSSIRFADWDMTINNWADSIYGGEAGGVMA